MHPIARVILTFLAALALAMVVGCSSGRPQIAAKDVALGERSDEASVLQFNLHLANRSDQPLKLLRFEYEVEIDGETAFEGIRSAEATLAANSERELTIPAVWRRDHPSWTAWSSGAAPSSYSLSGRLWYVGEGAVAQVLLETGIVRPAVGFSSTGAVPAQIAKTPD